MMQRLCLQLACCFIVALSAFAARGAAVSLGPVTAATALPNGALMALAGGGNLRIEFLEKGIVHVEVTPPGGRTLSTSATLPLAAAAGSAEVYQDSATVFLRQGAMSAIVVKSPMQVLVMRSDGSVISADLPGGVQWDAAAGTIVSVKSVRPDERFFGMGLAGGSIDRRGREMTMRNTDLAAYQEQSNPLYSSTPFFYGHTGGATYGLFFDNPSISVFDFGKRSPNLLTIAAVGGTLKYYVMVGPTPADVAHSFAALTGSTPRPPRWAMGYLQAHFGYASAAEVLGLASEFRSRQIPCDAFFLDLDYTDRLFSLSWNPTTFPNPVAFNSQMAGMGFKRVNILEPLLTVYDPLWSYAAGSGYLVLDPTGNPLITNIWMGDVSWLDFSKPAARNFFKSALKLFLSTGVSGLWADLNEPAANQMPYAVFDFDGKPRYEYTTRNIYALLEAEVLRDALAEAQPGLRPFIVSRSGFSGIQRYAANWSGDTDSSFDSLRVQVQIAASMGLSGQNFFGADIGGFLGSPNAELFIRWMQFGAATPFMRNHSMNTSSAREPWRFGEPYTSVAKATIEWRYRLMPYLTSLFAQAESKGTPVLAPTFFHFPSDGLTHAQSGEFMLGSSMLVAPVVTEGAFTRSLYLPAGATWVDYHSGAAYAGGQQVVVAAPLQQLPTLVRAGSIIPMGPVRQHAEQAVDDYLLLDVFAGANGSFTFTEDDGATTQYRGGNQRQTPLTWTESANSSQLVVGAAVGNRAAGSVPWWLQVRQWSTLPTRVSVDGVTLARVTSPANLGDAGGWTHDSNNRVLLIRLPGRQPAQSVRIDR
jgi:alpha-glucosidase